MTLQSRLNNRYVKISPIAISMTTLNDMLYSSLRLPCHEPMKVYYTL
jgi:hypothetical protein